MSNSVFLYAQTTTKRMKVVRDVVKRAMGLAPYEKRILEVIKVRLSQAGQLAVVYSDGAESVPHFRLRRPAAATSRSAHTRWPSSE